MTAERPAKVYSLYCLTRATDRRDSTDSGVIRCDAGAITALLGEVSWLDYCGPAAETRMQDLTWLGPRVSRHEMVVEQAMWLGPILPARFATLFQSLGRVERFIEHHASTIAQFLEFLGDRREWAVKGFYRSDAIRAIAERAPTGTEYLRQRRRLALERHTDSAELSRILESAERQLKDLARDARERRVWHTGEDGSGQLIANWAYLVSPAHEVPFRTRVEELNLLHCVRGVNFVLSGPWPPYTFTPVLGEVAT